MSKLNAILMSFLMLIGANAALAADGHDGANFSRDYSLVDNYNA
jgi:hypothetical protein